MVEAGFRERDSYVIVGAGAAGLILALRLLEAGSNVTLVERGSEFADGKSDALDPLDWGFAAYGKSGAKDECEGTRHLTAPQTELGGRALCYPQGSGLGGSTNINACIWTAGHPAVFDTQWPVQWNSQQMSQYLSSVKRLLSPIVTAASEGTPDAILTRRAVAATANGTATSSAKPLTDSSAEDSSFWNAKSWRSAYLATAGRGSAEASTGASRLTRLQDLVRNHGATAAGGKLVLHCDAEAEFVVFEGTAAVGVHVRLKTGKGLLLRPVGSGEIVLCCGAFETPRLLIASGLKGESLRSVGSAQYQRQLSAEKRLQRRERDREQEGGSGPARGSKGQSANATGAGTNASAGSVNLIGIGANLQDHLVLPVICLGNWWSRPRTRGLAAVPGAEPDRRSWLQWLWALCTPPASVPVNSVHGWVDLDASGRLFGSAASAAAAAAAAAAAVSASATATAGGQSQSESESDCGGGASPSAQLVFIDGRMAAGILPEMILPRFSRPYLYSAILRPLLVAALRFLLRLSVAKWLCGFVFGFLVCLTKPHSRGGLVNPATTLDPETGAMRPQPGPLLADPAYLSDERDVATLRAAVATAHALLEESRQRDGLWYLELLPGLPFNYCLAADFFALYARLFAAPFYHACGTCQMGGGSGTGSGAGSAAAGEAVPVATTARALASSEAATASAEAAAAAASASEPSGKRLRRSTAVVDPELRVYGVSGLRIADASVFPAIPSGPIAAVCMAVGEGAARLLLRDQQLRGAPL